jgi:hypothetical protein
MLPITSDAGPQSNDIAADRLWCLCSRGNKGRPAAPAIRILIDFFHRHSDAVIEGMKTVGRRGVFGYFEGYGPICNIQMMLTASLKRLLRPRISAPPAFLHIGAAQKAECARRQLRRYF